MPPCSRRDCPRTYDLSGDGKTLLTGSYGRYYASIIQGFSDAFAQVAQQANYNNYMWNGSAFVFSNRVQVSGSSFTPNLDLKPSHVDEATVGFQRQFGRSMGAGVRYISPQCGATSSTTSAPSTRTTRSTVRSSTTTRPSGTTTVFSSRGEAVLEQLERAAASYTYSRTEAITSLTTSRRSATTSTRSAGPTVDLTVGNNGVIPCAEVQNGANKNGAADLRPAAQLQDARLRTCGPIGPIILTSAR